jgi:hypothetical protein
MAPLPRRTGYTKLSDGPWYLYIDEQLAGRMPSEGWKLHVGGTADKALQILIAVLPLLREIPVNHKYAIDTSRLEYDTRDHALHKRDCGKWLVVYPESPAMAFDVVRQLDNTLGSLQLKHDNVVPVLTDMRVGKTCVFARYGGYETDNILSSDGKLTAYNPETEAPVPGWIQNIWLQYDRIMNPGRGSPAMYLPSGFMDTFPRYDIRGKLRN